MVKMNVVNKLDSGMGFSRRHQSNVDLYSLLFMFFSLSLFLHGDAADTITQGQSLRDDESIVSQNKKFVLGFFRPGNSTSQYVGIWYNNLPEQSVVWIANRKNPVSAKGSVFTIGNNGNLMVLDGNGNPVWSTNASVASKNSTATLMDSGNLILSSSAGKALWQSFNDPTDTFVPDMKVYVNAQEGQNNIFTSWKSVNDPSPGKYLMGIDPRGSPQIVIWEGLTRRWRSGHWNGLIFTGIADARAVYLYGFKLLYDENRQVYFTYNLANISDLIKFQIRWDGIEEQVRWDEDRKQWTQIQAHPDDECESYNRCGPFGKCMATDSPVCSCIDGFVPRNMTQWNQGNWSDGCFRGTELQCKRNSSVVDAETGGEDGFLKIDGVKLPDFADSISSKNIEDCEQKCLKNCSCNAYGYVNGINCMMWSGDLIDVQQFAEDGNTLYIRVAKSELGGRRRVSKFVIIAITVVGTFLLSASFCLLWRSKARLQETTNSWRNNKKWQKFRSSPSGDVSTDLSGPVDLSIEGQQGMETELTVYNFSTIAAATNDFSLNNRLGQGGFGAVYKAKLPGGEEIAVKRLSTKSRQGLDEFKNEIIVIAKLQHRNLVRLLGCCIEGEERMLVYEYMPNKSLDSFLFDPARQALLDWKKRFGIIAGIARGLIYLHRDSRLRIIHRDLKGSNILLDEEMNPKISDFGLARIFGGNENEASTNRVVGTYGYMSPEYAMEGLFSVKSDVYSFGVLLLEIISGRRSVTFRTPQYSSIIQYAWDLWKSGNVADLIDPSIVSSCCIDEVLRCIQVGLLCVQDLAIHRPTMPSVLLMLESETTTLPLPRPPTLTSMRTPTETDLWKENYDMVNSNDVTMTVIVGR